MMQIHHIQSGSAGNATLVSDGESALLLDCGLTYRKLVAGLREVGYRPSDLAGVLVTHEHGDHSKGAYELLRRGVPVSMSLGTARELFDDVITDQPRRQDIDRKGARLLRHGQQERFGSWLVLPFDCNHDAAEPLGFLFQSTVTGEKGVYIVDSAIVDFGFEGVTHWMLECNYQEELLAAGPYEDFIKDRVRSSHMSLDNLKTFLGSSDLSETQEIHLMHLSDANSDAEAFKNEFERQTGIPTYVA